jgi:hypothetical protein
MIHHKLVHLLLCTYTVFICYQTDPDVEEGDDVGPLPYPTSNTTNILANIPVNIGPYVAPSTLASCNPYAVLASASAKIDYNPCIR